MKPIYLEFCGVNSFSERAEVDFGQLLEFGIFGIFGDTGSGKSTILDCIVFALYGKVSRLDSKDAVISNLINYNSDRAYVNFEFEIEFEKRRRRYRVERELKRKNSQQNARVYERKGDTLSALAEGTRDSNALLERIIGLEQRDFEKCIALPQGEFAQFVKSQRSDRLKLISRLFDLEGYGEGLVKKINKRYFEIRQETDVLKARLEQYESVTEAGIAQTKQDLKALSVREQTEEKSLMLAREEERKLSERNERRKTVERLIREMEKLEADRDGMKALSDGLARLEKASAVIAAAREENTARLRAEEYAKHFSLGEAELRNKESAVKRAAEYDAEEGSEKINRFTESLIAARSREKDEATAREYQQKIQQIDRDFAHEAAQFQGFSYEKERTLREEKLHALGNGSFLDFAEEHGKAGLLRGEYAVFADELTALTERHTEIEADSRPLIEKYRGLSEGEHTDFTKLRALFEKRERARTAVIEELNALEKAKARYDMHLAELSRLQTERQEWKNRLEALAPRLQEGGATCGELEKELAALKADHRARTEEKERAVREYSAAQAEFAAITERKKGAEERQKEAVVRLNECLLAGGFESADEALALSKQFGDPVRARERVEKFREDYAATKRQLRELSQEDLSLATDEGVQRAKAELAEREKAFRELTSLIALKKSELARAEGEIEKKKELTAQYREKHREAEISERLKELLSGNKFMEFVAEEYLQTVAHNASGRLLSLTDGRYFLRYDKGFAVGDNFNGGALRGVFTLSGGETFLVSLSLALALGAEICRRSLRPIEFFFLDEGFGTLDEKLVDTVMDSLEKLKGEHFSIGIISHVEELRHRIERKISVKKATERHGSQITLE